VINPSIGATRTEQDFKNHIAKTLDTDPEAGWIFIVDQLNIHKSESLVRLVAQRCGIQIDLGVTRQVWHPQVYGNPLRFPVQPQPSDSRESTSRNILLCSIRSSVGASLLMRRLLKRCTRRFHAL
jgi:hypothetical protein